METKTDKVQILLLLKMPISATLAEIMNQSRNGIWTSSSVNRDLIADKISLTPSAVLRYISVLRDRGLISKVTYNEGKQYYRGKYLLNAVLQ